MDHVDSVSQRAGRWRRAWTYRLTSLLPASLRSRTAESPVSPASQNAMFEHARVLVADDDGQSRVMTCELLDQWGIKPMMAGDGAEAVALACGNQFSMILMDLQMPVLDGLAATIEIRRFEREAGRLRTAIVAHTSCSPGGSLLEDCGFDALLEKPSEPIELQACLVRWCPRPIAA